MVALASDSVAIRLYCASGGLMGYLTKLLDRAERNAIGDDRRVIELNDLAIAYRQAVWHSRDASIPDPFAPDFSLRVSEELLQKFRAVAIPAIEHLVTRRRGPRKAQDLPLSSLLVAR
jgi:hypothetical protein